MILQYIGLAINVFLSPLVPPALVPLAYSWTSVLLLQHANPLTLSLISVGVSTLSTIIIRFSQNYIIEKLALYEHLNKKNKLSFLIHKINTYFRNQKRIARISLKREKYIEKRSGRFVTFLFAILCYLPILPDIITTRILYKKIRFRYFIIAVIIGKTITYVPFIYLGKTLFQLLHI
ncbi:TPA: hypothetical protein DEP21_06075 [Patescibacteria group bacterium]|nr:hypothetical protein [Candidatus Gracilibacteria bacterium]